MKKVLIVGGGLAGCYLAARLQDSCDVTIITKGSKAQSNSMLAQGGIAAALDPGDTPEAHEADTLKAGCYHNIEPAVAQLVTAGPELLKQLIAQGMPFDRDADGQLSFGLEGAHSCHRVLHAEGDQTGHALTSFVQQQLHKVSWVVENTQALALVVEAGVCRGVIAEHADGKREAYLADAVVLASGGLGNLYTCTTNDQTVTGDGIAMAARAGVALRDMAFVQFHPTLLALDGQCFGLVTEAIRGAGAILVDEEDTPIMADIPNRDLAPRDVVARQLLAWQRRGHQLFLDISGVADFAQHFPGVAANLDRHAVPFRETKRIPIQPGAHFMMGGIATDMNAQTSLPQLWAVGEVACNGVHGANRLASNSLLDCLVSAAKAAETITASQPATAPVAVAAWPQADVAELPTLAALQAKSWQALGVVRTTQGIQDYLAWLAQFADLSRDPLTLAAAQRDIANLALCSKLIAEAALAQPHSLGAHYIEETITC